MTPRSVARTLGGRPAVWVLALLVVGLAIATPHFLSVDNIRHVATNASILVLAALGQTIVILTRGLDLSSGSVVGLMSVVIVLTVPNGLVLGMAAGFAVALGAGVLNGVLVARFDMPPFLATLGTLTGLAALAQLLVGGTPIEASPGSAFSWPATGEIGPIPVPVIIAALAVAALSRTLRKTSLGRTWYLIGASPEAAAAAGVRVRVGLLSAYVAAAAFVGLAGLMLTARVHSGQPALLTTLPFQAIAACAIGGVLLSGGAGRATDALIGAVLLAVLDNGLNLLNVSSDVQLIAIGVITVAGVVAQQVTLPRRRVRRAPAVELPTAGRAA